MLVENGGYKDLDGIVYELLLQGTSRLTKYNLLQSAESSPFNLNTKNKNCEICLILQFKAEDNTANQKIYYYSNIITLVVKMAMKE